MAATGPSDVPYAAEWLAVEEATGGHMVLTGDVHSIRQQFNGLTTAMAAMVPPADDSVSTSEHKTSEGVVVRVYKPKDAKSSLPTGLYIHAGGWSCGSVDGEDHIARHLARSVPCILVSPDYRLAPENPFPAALDDTTSAFKWMASSEDSLGGDTNKLFTVGGSAGGNLSLTTALRVIDDGGLNGTLKAVFALCPGTIMPQATPSLPEDLKPYSHPDAYEDAAMINVSVYKTCGGKIFEPTVCTTRSLTFTAAYFGASNPAHPLISPIFHPNLSQLPYVYTTAANHDPTHDDAYMLRHRLRQEGVPHTLNQYDGFPHFFHIVASLGMSRKYMADLAEAIREKCG